MPYKYPHRMNPVSWSRHMTHTNCGTCRRAARQAKTDTIVTSRNTATQTIREDDGTEHTATVIRREGRQTT